MVISNIIGGLGNQMFQYAAGKALALRHNTSHCLDVSDFENYGLHQGFELQRIFACPTELASTIELRNILGWQSSPGIRRILSRTCFAVLRRKGLIVEPRFNYWPEINHAPSNSYLVGYWQSEKYFGDQSETIRSDFTFRLPLDKQNEELVTLITQSNAVSLHVRRGDYAKNPGTLAIHGLCSLDYYHAAVKYIADRIESPHFFVFSDDMPWVRENLKPAFSCQFIGHNLGADSYIDMQLMSLCRHNIIANSSFSWWGAWLNHNSAKIVIAPRKWFADGRAVDDLFPQGWIRL